MLLLLLLLLLLMASASATATQAAFLRQLLLRRLGAAAQSIPLLRQHAHVLVLPRLGQQQQQQQQRQRQHAASTPQRWQQVEK
jgi:hypothetical protein